MKTPTYQPTSSNSYLLSTGILQRKCACANTPGLEEECEECRQRKAIGMQARLRIGALNDPLEVEADRVAEQVLGHRSVIMQATPVTHRLSRCSHGSVPARTVPDSVSNILRTRGEPLSDGTRAFFEPRFGHDFSRVRVHHDAHAATSAEEVNAHAYTVGHHVVFAPDQFYPDSSTGKELLAHELAHVVQQTDTLQRSAVSAEPEVNSDPREDEELRSPEIAEEGGLAGTHEADGGFGYGGPASRLFPPPIDSSIEGAPLPRGLDRDALETERACLATAPPDPVDCDPARALTWGDFTANVPRRSRFGAMTSSSLRERAINTALTRCAPYTSPQTRSVQAFFNPARSWVKPEFANASNPAQNGCNRTVRRCRAFFDREARAGRVGATFGMNNGPVRGCAASARARGDQANARAQCATVVARDCRDARVAESARLLGHEQGHFNLTCAMARKANVMITSATSFPALLRAARTTLSRQQRLYDSQTNHGCIAAQQTSWETAIAAGLPGVVIRVRSRGRGRSRRGRGRR